MDKNKLIEGIAEYLPAYIKARDDYSQMMATVDCIDMLISKGYIKEEALFDLVEGNRKLREVMAESLKILMSEMDNMSVVFKGGTPTGKPQTTEVKPDGTIVEWLEHKS